MIDTNEDMGDALSMSSAKSTTTIRRRRVVMAAFALAGLTMPTAAAEAPNATEVQRAMRGTWTGDGTTLVIDIDRLQANLDPEKPFEWKAVQIVNVTGKMVVFDIGPMRYVALMSDAQTMTLTSPSFLGERALRLQHR